MSADSNDTPEQRHSESACDIRLRPVRWAPWKGIATVTESGIEFNCPWKRFSILWDDVVDYFDCYPVDGDRGIVVVGSQNRVVLKGDWKNVGEAREAIQKRATAARTKRWALHDARPEVDWPRAFCYNTRSARAGVILGIGAIIALVVLSVLGAWAYYHSLSIPGLRSAFLRLGVVIVAMCWFGLPDLVKYVIPGIDAMRRSDHRLTLSNRGVRFEDRNGAISAKWGEVTKVEVVRNRANSLLIATPSGVISLTDRIDGFLQIVEGTKECFERAHRSKKPD